MISSLGAQGVFLRLGLLVHFNHHTLAGAGTLLDGQHAQQDRDNDIGKETQNLDGDQDTPQLVGIHLQHSGGAGHGSAPGQQIHHAHAGAGETHQNPCVNVHPLVYGVHGGDRDEDGGGGSAVHVGDGGDDGSGDGHGDDAFAGDLD